MTNQTVTENQFAETGLVVLFVGRVVLKAYFQAIILMLAALQALAYFAIDNWSFAKTTEDVVKEVLDEVPVQLTIKTSKLIAKTSVTIFWYSLSILLPLAFMVKAITKVFYRMYVRDLYHTFSERFAV